MMQPILLSNQPTPKDNDRLSELSTSDKSLKVDDQLSSDVKSKDNFSGLLGSAIKGSDKRDVKTTTLSSLIKPNGDNKSSSLETSLIKNITTDTKADPIVAQIETAQKANTTLSAPKELIQSNNDGLTGNALLQKGVKKDALMDNQLQLKPGTMIKPTATIEEGDSRVINNSVKPVNALSDNVPIKSTPSITSQGIGKQPSSSALQAEISLDANAPKVSIMPRNEAVSPDIVQLNTINKDVQSSSDQHQVNVAEIQGNKSNIELASEQNMSSAVVQPLAGNGVDSIAEEDSSPSKAVRQGIFSAKPSKDTNLKDTNIEPIRRGLFTAEPSVDKLTIPETDAVDGDNKFDNDGSDTSELFVAAGFVAQPTDFKHVESTSKEAAELSAKSQTGAESISGINISKQQSATAQSTQNLKLDPSTAIDGKAKLVSTLNTEQHTEDNALSKKLEKSTKFQELLNQNNDSEKPMAVPTNVARVNDLNTFNLHKLESQNNPLNTDPSKLQQSIDLHSKHAANMLGERVLMMINQGKQEVQIRLDPAELGSMHLKLHMHQNQLQLSIQTDVGQSRDIIEQNMPKLREQLAQQGVNLGEANIEQRSQNQQQNGNQSGRSSVVNHQSTTDHDNGMLNNEGNIDWKPVKIPLPAQGIDYYA